MKRFIARTLTMIILVTLTSVPTYASEHSGVTYIEGSDDLLVTRNTIVKAAYENKFIYPRLFLIRRLHKLIESYAPEEMQAFMEAFESHQSLHEELKAIHLELKEVYNEDELSEIAKEIRPSMKEWILENGNDKNEIKALLKDMRDAVEEDNTQQIVDLLDKAYDMIMIHLDVDTHRIELLNEAL